MDIVFSNSQRTQYCLCNTFGVSRDSFLRTERLRMWTCWHGVEAAVGDWLNYKHLSTVQIKKKRGMLLCCFEIYSVSYFQHEWYNVIHKIEMIAVQDVHGKQANNWCQSHTLALLFKTYFCNLGSFLQQFDCNRPPLASCASKALVYTFLTLVGFPQHGEFSFTWS